MVLLLVCVVAFYGLTSYVPFSYNEYSAAPAIIIQGELYQVSGQLVFENGSPIALEPVTIYGTDQLDEVTVMTDLNGYFATTIEFEMGQIITIKVLGVKTTVFLPYEASPHRIWFRDGIEYVDIGTVTIVP